MPELPEVETVRRGLAPHVQGRCIESLEIRQPSLRWPVDLQLEQSLLGLRINALYRRGKYLLFDLGQQALMVHLGMSGSLRLLEASNPWRKHDHIQWQLEGGHCLRYHDPRRFGSVHAFQKCPIEPEQSPLTAFVHPLLDSLGPEPLSTEFSGDYLYQRAKSRSLAVKSFIMDSHVVVGVGNIYANEALFMAGIRPDCSAGSVSKVRYKALAEAIVEVLSRAIEQGGTTLRDFVNGSGQPGYFQQTLNVYGRADEPCRRCASVLRSLRLGQRATVYCPRCQR